MKHRNIAIILLQLGAKMQMYGLGLAFLGVPVLRADPDGMMFWLGGGISYVGGHSIIYSVIPLFIGGFYYSRYKRNYLWLILAPIPLLGWFVTLAEEKVDAFGKSNIQLPDVFLVYLLLCAKIMIPVGVALQASSFSLDFISFEVASVVMGLAMGCFALSKGRAFFWGALAILPGIGLMILPHLQDANAMKTTLASDEVRVHDSQSEGFVMKKSWYAWHSMFLFFVFVFVSSAALTGSQGVPFEAVVVMLVAYVFLCFFINHTIIKIDASHLLLTHHYLPLLGKNNQSKSYLLEDILDVSIKEYHADSSTPWHPAAIMKILFFPIKQSHQVYIKTASGMHRLIGFSELDNAQQLEQKLLIDIHKADVVTTDENEVI